MASGSVGIRGAGGKVIPIIVLGKRTTAAKARRSSGNSRSFGTATGGGGGTKGGGVTRGRH